MATTSFRCFRPIASVSQNKLIILRDNGVKEKRKDEKRGEEVGKEAANPKKRRLLRLFSLGSIWTGYLNMRFEVSWDL